jgi:hypothetical protein
MNTPHNFTEFFSEPQRLKNVIQGLYIIKLPEYKNLHMEVKVMYEFC